MRRFNTGYEDGNFSVPAGHLEGDETARSAVVREASEEAGVKISRGDLTLIHVMHRRTEDVSNERVDFFFACSSWQGEPMIMEPSKCDAIAWCGFDSLPDNIVPYLRFALACAEKGVLYSEFGW
jgi:8-oxo-dGTP diphosphatase